MNKSKEKVWKKLSKTELKLGNAITDTQYTATEREQDLINDLKDKLDSTFELHDVKTLMNPNTYEPITIARIIRTEKK